MIWILSVISEYTVGCRAFRCLRLPSGNCEQRVMAGRQGGSLPGVEQILPPGSSCKYISAEVRPSSRHWHQFLPTTYDWLTLTKSHYLVNMIFPTLALGAALLATFQPAAASTRYGCWGKLDPKFHADCAVAASSLLIFQMSGDRIYLPRAILEQQWGNCRVQMKGDNGGSVPAAALFASLDILISRCQRGYFQYPELGFNFNVLGPANWKRNLDSADFQEIDATHDDSLSLPSPKSLELYNKPTETLPPPASVVNAAITERNHPRDLEARDRPRGRFIEGGHTRNTFFNLYRGTQVIINGLTPYLVKLAPSFPSRIDDLVNSALTNPTRQVISTGIASVTSGASNTIILTASLVAGFQSWQQVFNQMGDSGSLVYRFMEDAVTDFADGKYTYAFYTIYDRKDVPVITFILNGVHGQTTNLP